MIDLRPFQAKLKRDIYDAWQDGAQNVMAIAPTGAGKTVLFSDILREYNAPSCVIAHRHELVSQISLALARNEVPHRIIGQPGLMRTCVNLHMQELGRSYYNPQAPCAAAGVDTLIRMDASQNRWFAQVGLWVQDEAHHLLRENKWGAGAAMFPNARGLGVTATPLRADGKGLGRHADGLMDVMVQAPTMRELIKMGYLSEYRIFAPMSDVKLADVKVGASGDYVAEALRAVMHKSHIVGDVVSHYKRIANGKRGITFAVDVASAAEIADAYRKAGVPAEVVSAKTPDNLRFNILQKLRRGELLQLVNVDLFGEGFDLPAIEVVSMARPTLSFALYSQQFGRAVRLLEGKSHGIIIDHVSNVRVHGLPDAPRRWSLDRREKRATAEPEIMVRVCPACTATYERLLGPVCPYCGHVAQPVGRGYPAEVDGDLHELSAEALATLRGEIDAPAKWHPDPIVQATNAKRVRERDAAQGLLRDIMAVWGGARDPHEDIESCRRLQREFFLPFGVDVLSAQALNATEAKRLMDKIARAL